MVGSRRGAKNESHPRMIKNPEAQDDLGCFSIEQVDSLDCGLFERPLKYSTTRDNCSFTVIQTHLDGTDRRN